MMSFDVHWCWCWMLEQPLIREIIDRGLKGLHSRYLSLGFFSDRPGFLCVPGPCRGEPQGSDLGSSPLDLFSLSAFYVKFSCCLISRCYHRTWRSLEFLLTSRENGFTLKNQNLLFFSFSITSPKHIGMKTNFGAVLRKLAPSSWTIFH